MKILMLLIVLKYSILSLSTVRYSKICSAARFLRVSNVNTQNTKVRYQKYTRALVDKNDRFPTLQAQQQRHDERQQCPTPVR